MDTTYQLANDRLRGFIFFIFIGFVIACIWLRAMAQAGTMAEGRSWTLIGGLLGAIVACIGIVAWIDHRGGWSVLSDQTRRGFDVIFNRKNDNDQK